MNIKESAEYYRVGVLIGLIDKAEAIAWVDSVILAEDQPELELIEASMCGSKRLPDFSTTFARIGGTANRHIVIRQLFKTMLAIVERDRFKAKLVTRYLELMVIEGYAPSTQAEGYMRGIDDEFSFSEAWSSQQRDNLTKGLIDFLQLHISDART
jgi:hypothetical protein